MKKRRKKKNKNNNTYTSEIRIRTMAREIQIKQLFLMIICEIMLNLSLLLNNIK